MSKTILNLSLSMVSEELDQILDSELFTLYTQTFSESELRQKLTTYVLSRIPGEYVVLDEAEVHQFNLANLDLMSKQRQQIRALIQQGIEQGVTHSEEPIEAAVYPSGRSALDPIETECTFTPSTWFG